MLVAFLGSARTGHPYIPLDSSLPHHRVKQVIATLAETIERVARMSLQRSIGRWRPRGPGLPKRGISTTRPGKLLKYQVPAGHHDFCRLAP
jgi:hypothetical protein